MPDRSVILHCMGGGRSSLAADTLQRMGFTHAPHMHGGLRRLNAVEKSSCVIARISRARVRESLLAITSRG